MYQQALLEVCLVDLTLSVPEISTADLASLYPAPDALASISASFLRDYNPRIPFSKQARLPTRAEPSPFMPATVHLQTASLDLNARLHAVTSAGPSGAQTSPLSSSSNVLTSSPLNPGPVALNLHSLQRFSHISHHGSAPCPNELITQSSGSTSTKTPSENLNLPHLEPTPIVQVAEGSSRVNSSPSTTQLQSSPVVNVPNAQIQSQNRTSNSSSPIAGKMGVKRRLGMGRCATGYSNKKFKSHM